MIKKVKKVMLVMVTMLTCSSSWAQNKADSVLKLQAIQMGQAFVNEEFKTFVSFTYPPLVKAAGGETKMVEVLKKTIGQLKSQGMKVADISFDNPTKIIKVDKILQSTIMQHTKIQRTLGDNAITTTSTLIALSNDNGMHWKFIDTSGKDIAAVRKLVPTLSKEITIPAQKPQ